MKAILIRKESGQLTSAKNLAVLASGRRQVWADPQHREKMRKVATETISRTNARRAAGEYPEWDTKSRGCRRGHGPEFARPSGRGGCMMCNRLKTYNLSFEAYEQMVEKQHGKCALCPRTGKLHIDHDHETGKVRGLLCNRCNTGLGKLGDSADRLRAAIAYLEQ